MYKRQILFYALKPGHAVERSDAALLIAFTFFGSMAVAGLWELSLIHILSDRRLQVPLSLEAKIASDFSLVRAIFAFVGFVSALKGRFWWNLPFSSSHLGQPLREGGQEANALFDLIKVHRLGGGVLAAAAADPGGNDRHFRVLAGELAALDVYKRQGVKGDAIDTAARRSRPAGRRPAAATRTAKPEFPARTRSVPPARR